MPIREKSFRIGCGRYLQGENIILTHVGNEVIRLGNHPIIIGDHTSMTIAGGLLKQGISQTCQQYETVVYNGTCCEESARAIARMKEEKGADVIVGIGGGVIMDYAKLCGYFAKCPVVNIPTSSATCAAYTPLSVRYTPEGGTVGTLHYDHEVDAVLVDTAIISKQPIRLMLSGVFDALAKFVEIKQRYHVGYDQGNGSVQPEGQYPLGLPEAYVLSTYTYDLLTNTVSGCIQDMEKGIITNRLDNIIFASIATTGVISGIARGSNQCALAHKFYETTRVLFRAEAQPYLHGEIVGIGLLLQNFFNGEEGNNSDLLKLMNQYHMPHRISDVGIHPTEAVLEDYYIRLCESSAIDKDNKKECQLLHQGLVYLWGIQ